MEEQQDELYNMIAKMGGDLLQEDEIRRLAEASRIRSYAKGEHVLDIGEVAPAVGFLVSGVIGAYLFDDAGQENTDCLVARPGSIVMPFVGLTEPTPVCIEALLPSDILLVDMRVVQEMMEKSLGLNKLYNRFLIASWKHHWAIKRVMCELKAKDRYLWFLKEHPGLEDVVSGRRIAAYLGMTPVTLSRLRSSMRASDE